MEMYYLRGLAGIILFDVPAFDKEVFKEVCLGYVNTWQ